MIEWGLRILRIKIDAMHNLSTGLKDKHLQEIAKQLESQTILLT